MGVTFDAISLGVRKFQTKPKKDKGRAETMSRFTIN